MRYICLMTSVAFLALNVPTADAAPTAAERFQQIVERKVAQPFGTIANGKFKALCVCNASDKVGVLESFAGIPELGITCTVPTFTEAGDYSIGTACYDWTPLTK